MLVVDTLTNIRTPQASPYFHSSVSFVVVPLCRYCGDGSYFCKVGDNLLHRLGAIMGGGGVPLLQQLVDEFISFIDFSASLTTLL